MRRHSVIVRSASPETERLLSLLFSRYPAHEWATFARFGWRDTGNSLVLTIAALDPPTPGDLNGNVPHVAIDEAYTLRVALGSEQHPFGVGVVHSHPEGCPPIASPIDDDMDSYYSAYFGDFAPDRPYVSLIAAKLGGELVLSGRVWWRGQWRGVDRFCVEGTLVQTWAKGYFARDDIQVRERTARLNAAFGTHAAVRLRQATVAVIGAGGTGSAAIEVLARAGVGRLIIVDPDRLTESNLERVHGSVPAHAARTCPKVSLAREHVHAIDPSCEVIGLVGSLPQDAVIDDVITADVMLGCTDQAHSRLALSDIALRYVIPALDSGVVLEGAEGTVTGQVIQLVRCLPADPCLLCRGMIDAKRVAEELMSPQERHQRQAAAEEAIARGEKPDPYWRGLPQLNTAGFLTTTAGAMLAGYAIGWITGRFAPPFSRLQMNLAAPLLDVTDDPMPARPDCACRRVRGWADQGRDDAFVTEPPHWLPVEVLR
jgi:molybdopterin/thiamine biosynthesis adenylyltransferase